jgi:hypothetical protein
MIDGELFRRLRQHRPDMDRWLTANAVFGAIVATALVAMAVVGSSQSGVTQLASATAPDKAPTRVQAERTFSPDASHR